MALTVRPPMAGTCTFSGRLFNYYIDAVNGRIWLEDNSTKHQWDWERSRWHSTSSPRDVPDEVFLTTMQHALWNHCETLYGYPAPRTVVADGLGSRKIDVTVAARMAASTWCAQQTFTLRQVPLTRNQLRQAQWRSYENKLAVLNARMAATEQTLRVLNAAVSTTKQTPLFDSGSNQSRDRDQRTVQITVVVIQISTVAVIAIAIAVLFVANPLRALGIGFRNG